MSQSLIQIMLHVVFSTKNRESWLQDEIRDELHAYIGGIIKNRGGVLLKAGSVSDHIHLLMALPRTCSAAEMVKHIKVDSSKWIKSKSVSYHKFYWQSGYGVFSISPSHERVVGDYIANQADHHRVVTFQDEYRRILKKYGVQFDEHYVWD
jgi:putative transposase